MVHRWFRAVWFVSPVRMVSCGGPGLLFSLLVCGAFLAIPCTTVRAQLSAGSVGSSPAGGSADTTAPSTVMGQVINASTGAPIARALVRLNSRAVLTDHDGKFRFEQNTQSSANVLVSKPGYTATTEMQEAGNVFLRGAQMGVPLELRLYPEAVLTGTVIAPDGTPLPRIQVTALRGFYDDSGHRWQTVGQTQTDSHGNFRLPESAGEYRLETRYTPQDRTIGEAVLPVTVPSDSSSNGAQAITVHSGEEVHFELRPGVGPVHTVTTAVEASPGRDFVRITARSSDGSTLQVNPQISGTSGETKIQLPQGTYTLTARRNDQERPEQAETTVTVPDHDISGVVLQFSPVPSIAVELVIDTSSTSDNSEQPPALQQLGLQLQSAEPDPDRGDGTIRPTMRRDQSFVFTAPPGRYRLEGRNTGSWYIKSVSYGDSDLLQGDLVVVPGAAGSPIRVTVSDQTGSLQGAVNLNGSPASCWIYLIPNGPSAQAVITLRSSTTGAFTVTHLPPGSYRAIAFEQRHSADYRDATALATFSSHVHSVTVNVGDKPTLNLDAVPVAEVTP